MDIIKLDVEGYEAVVILGNKDKILKDKPIIFLEFNPVWIDREGSFSAKQLFEFFLDNNYDIFSRIYNKNLSYSDLDLQRQDNWITIPK